ncbi:MAG: hypothetical protein JWM98_3199 [Thermoleophilia bacterium]|nr:hypothetical protein [Thermoleophilia bacterium]
MDPLVTAHVVVALLLVVTAVVVGVWGLVRARTIASDRSPGEGRAFSHLLQLSHTLVFAASMLGLALWADGHHAHDPLHTRVYGPFMLVAIVAAYGYRTRDAKVNVRVFAAASLVVAALGLRAFATGG